MSARSSFKQKPSLLDRINAQVAKMTPQEIEEGLARLKTEHSPEARKERSRQLAAARRKRQAEQLRLLELKP